MINCGASVTDTRYSFVSHLALKRLHWIHDEVLSFTFQSMTAALITVDSPVDAFRVAGVSRAVRLHCEPRGLRT